VFTLPDVPYARPMRPTRLLLATLVVFALGCDKGSTSPPSGGSDKKESDDKSDKKKKSKDDEGDDDDDQAPKKKKEAAKDDDDDDDKPSGGSKSKLPDKAAVQSALGAFFAQYVDGASFAFYGDTFAPSVDKFLSMKSTTPTEMAKQARAFYTGKTGLKYTPQNATLIVTPDPSGDRETASLDVKMEWKYPPQKGWDAPDKELVFHEHVATVEIVVGADGKWTSYGEPGLKRDTYAVVTPESALGAWTSPADVMNDDTKAPLVLHKGDKVQDGFEWLVVEYSAKGAEVARKIHKDGKDYWAMQNGAVAVDNPNGGTSAGEETYLQKVK
jgi:hypothetical protein